MKKILIIMLLFSGCSLLEDDIVFISPKAGSSVTDSLTIELQPKHDDVSVRVWIESSTDTMIWSGTLASADNYKTTVDLSDDKYANGKYELNAEYYIDNKDYDGDVDFWIQKN